MLLKVSELFYHASSTQYQIQLFKFSILIVDIKMGFCSIYFRKTVISHLQTVLQCFQMLIYRFAAIIQPLAGTILWFAVVTKHFAGVTECVAGVTKHFAGVTKYFAGVTKRLSTVFKRFQTVTFVYLPVTYRVAATSAGVARVLWCGWLSSRGKHQIKKIHLQSWRGFAIRALF